MFPLLRYFSIASALAIVAVTIALSLLYRNELINNMTHVVERQNAALAQSYANTIWPTFRDYVKNAPNDGDKLRAHPETQEIHNALKMMNDGIPVLKVKMYSLQGLTVYSSQMSQIGQSKVGNYGFEAIVKGADATTKRSFRETFESFSGPVEGRHLVETYLPIRDANGQVEGVFELYTDVTDLYAEITNRTYVAIAEIFIALLILYSILYLIVRRANSFIRSQYERLESEVRDREAVEAIVEEKAEELIERNLELKHAMEAAEAANDTKSEFLATMSHEIRTPMSGVMGIADMLLSEELPVKHREQITRIKSLTQSLVSIINDILDISKLEAGKLEVEYLDFYMEQHVAEVIALFEGSNSDNLTLTLSLDLEFPQAVRSDPTRIRQILMNLIGNAVKFTHEGEVRIEGKRVQDDAGNEFIELSVVDTGIGISEDNIQKLFSEFTQADASISRKFEGTGLGLSICARLVDLLGGQIGVKSTLCEGSTFWFRVPYIEASASFIMDANEANAMNDSNDTVGPLKILVAEDNEVNQMIASHLLNSLGHKFAIVDDGADAVEALKESEFDLILMDIRMPNVSGPDATRMIRAMSGPKSAIPIIALTADAMAENRRYYIECGMDAVVTKPVDREELKKVIDTLMLPLALGPLGSN